MENLCKKELWRPSMSKIQDRLEHQQDTKKLEKLNSVLMRHAVTK